MPLQPEEQSYLQAQRGWLKAHFPDEREARYATVEGKIDLLDRILKNGWANPEDRRQLQALGAGLGDALVQELGMEWVTVQDEQGRDPAIHWPGTSVVCFPMTMISSRVEDGQSVDAASFYAAVRDALVDARGKAQA